MEKRKVRQHRRTKKTSFCCEGSADKKSGKAGTDAAQQIHCSLRSLFAKRGSGIDQAGKGESEQCTNHRART